MAGKNKSRVFSESCYLVEQAAYYGIDLRVIPSQSGAPVLTVDLLTTVRLSLPDGLKEFAELWNTLLMKQDSLARHLTTQRCERCLG